MIFLGDMLSSGHQVKGEEEYVVQRSFMQRILIIIRFAQYYAKFERVFSLSRNISVFYVPGNKDIG